MKPAGTLTKRGPAQASASTLGASAFSLSVDQMVSQNVPVEQVLAHYADWLSSTQDPLSYLIWFNYGALLQQVGQIDSAVVAYKRCLAMSPYFAPAVVNWGLCEEVKGDRHQAIALWRDGLPHFADHPPDLLHVKIAALNHLARATEELKDYEAAEQYLKQSLALDPNQPDAIHHWVHLQQLTCQWPVYKALEGIGKARQLLCTSPFAMLAYSDDPAEQLLSAREYLHRKIPAVSTVMHRGGSFLKTGQGRLKIAYVSGDFCMHAVGLLMPSVLESHDRDRVELYLYDFSREDGSPLRARLLQAFDHRRSIKGLSDEQAAAQIASDGVDVLIDMHGLSLGARPGIFALRPAPQQGQYLGFIGTTGMPWLDFVVVDRYVFTSELTQYFTEQPLFVDGCFLPLTRSEVPEQAFSRADCGLPEDQVVLAAFGNSYKVTETMFSLWLDIMKSAENCVLWILNDNPIACRSLREAAQRAGVDAERLIFQSRIPYGEFSARLRMADLFLDAYPYNCGSTARDVVQAGVPMVTLSGRTLVSRMGGSVLTAIGATDGIASSMEEYRHKVLDAIRKGPRTDRQASKTVRLALSSDWGRGVSRAIEARWI